MTGDDSSGRGMFSFGDLLGSGMASSDGTGFVSDAVKSIEKVRADVAAPASFDTKPAGLDTILDNQWTKLEAALDDIFGKRQQGRQADRPREEDILDDIDDILDALASEASFVRQRTRTGTVAVYSPARRWARPRRRTRSTA